MASIITAHNLAFAYGKRQLFTDLSFDLAPGQLMTILGPNGVGKSTLLRCLSGQSRPTAGEVLVNNRALSELPQRERARQIAIVPQEYRPATSLTVSDFVVTARAPYHALYQVPTKGDHALVQRILTNLGIGDLVARNCQTLSGGQMQLVAIAKALAQDPALLILDEPFAALDYGRQHQLIALLQDLTQQGITVILTTHLPNQSLILGGQVGLLNQKGRFLVGPCERVITEDRLRHLYDCPLRLLWSAELGRMICELEF